MKLDRKRVFLKACHYGLPVGREGHRVVIGDFNILEPTHTPRYRFFQPFEYVFYEGLAEAGYRDAFRALHPQALEYSWVGRTGDGYRYDHAHVSSSLVTALRGCSYVHEVRTDDERLTDHSALSVQLALTPAGLLPVTCPSRVEDLVPALF